jgi:hypothetical protein
LGVSGALAEAQIMRQLTNNMLPWAVVNGTEFARLCALLKTVSSISASGTGTVIIGYYGGFGALNTSGFATSGSDTGARILMEARRFFIRAPRMQKFPGSRIRRLFRPLTTGA